MLSHVSPFQLPVLVCGGGGERKKKKPAGRGQKHQNAFAFHHNKNSQKTRLILSLPNEGLCKRCHDIIEWKKQYRKYKPLSAPKRCGSCDNKTVTRAYHVICDPCAKSLGVCAKCKEKADIVSPLKTEEERRKEKAAEGQPDLPDMSFMTERERRTILRKLSKGEDIAGGEKENSDEDSDDDDDGGDAEDSDDEE